MLNFLILTLSLGTAAQAGFAGAGSAALGLFQPAHFSLPLAEADFNGWYIVGAALAGAVATWFVTRFFPQTIQRVRIDRSLSDTFATKKEVHEVSEASKKRRSESEKENGVLKEIVLTKEIYERDREHTDEWRAEFKGLLEKIGASVEGGKVEGSKQRREIYRKINAHDAALHWLAGNHEKGNEIYKRLQGGHIPEEEAE